MFLKQLWTLPASARVSMPNKTNLIPVLELPNLSLSWYYSPYHKDLNKYLLLLILQVFLFLLPAPLHFYSSFRALRICVFLGIFCIA